MMDERLEIAAGVIAGMMTYDAEKALAVADALIAAHEATAKPALAEDNGKPPLWKQIVELGRQIPDSEWANVPTDLSANLGRFLYGSTQPPALAEDAPVMEWDVHVETGRGSRRWVVAQSGCENDATQMCSPIRPTKAAALTDIPAVRAAAEAYSAAKGCKAVFVGEGCSDA